MSLNELVDAGVRSISCSSKASIMFFNSTIFPVDIIWIDYEGKFKVYKRLPSRGTFQIDTFKTHPWIALESRTRQRFLVNFKEIFTVDAVIENARRRNISPADRMFVIRLTLPNMTLKTWAELYILYYLKSYDFIPGIDVPVGIKNDLISRIENVNIINKQLGLVP